MTGMRVSLLLALVSLSLAACMPYFPDRPRGEAYPRNDSTGSGSGPFWAGGEPLRFGYHPPGQELGVDEVREGLQRWLARSGNPRLMVGKVFEKDALTITANVVTLDGSLVHTLDFDRRTGTASQLEGGSGSRAENPPRTAWWGGPGNRGGGWGWYPFCAY
jgi:hypothetical protein